MKPSRWKSALLLSPSLLWMTVFFLVPLLLVIGVSFATKKGVGIDWAWSTKAWTDLVKPPEDETWLDNVNVGIFIKTLWSALGTTVLCLALGFPAAWFIVKRPPRLRRVLYALVLIPLVANSLCLVYAWKTLLFQEGFVGSWLVRLHVGDPETGIYNTRWASLVGLVYYYLPFMVYPIYTSLEKLDWRLMEASADLGATPAKSFRHIILPLVWPGVGTGCVMVFIQTMGTFVIPDILAGNKDMLLGTLINQKFVGQAPNWPLGAAISLCVMTLIGLLLIIYFRLQDKMEK